MTHPISIFADSVADNFRQLIDAQPEDQLKAPVGNLLHNIGQLTGIEVGWRTEVRADDLHGRPDLGISIDQLLMGHIELKAPGVGARPERFSARSRNGGQWKRFQALPNLIYTDGLEWSLYRSGKRISRVRISDDVRESGSRGIEEARLLTLENILKDFLLWQPITPATAQGLAEFLAPLTRILRDEVTAALERGGNAQNSLRRLAQEWSGLLFPESDDAQFADAYAQTLTYALLLAKFEGAENLHPNFASYTLQGEHALLAQAIGLLEAPDVRRELIMPIELLERAIGAVDADAIQREADPWLYFYEQFLGEYDPKLRKDRGVYYTPVEVVRAQTRLAGELLHERFGKPLTFADDDVVVLDPATGTGTYPLAVLDHAEHSVRERLGPGAVPGKIRDLAGRLNGFEILVGPYAVAHLRISQRLRDAGVTDVPPRVYLTDTLESPNSLPDFTASILQERLTDERRRAQEIKKDTRVFVCIGNPPYDREQLDPDDDGRRKGGWVRYGDEGPDMPLPILEDFLAPASAAGAGIHLKNLYNDYVYFWRWALWKVFDSTNDAGIVTFITASSYLRGPGFVGMRRKMREIFDELWIIDLEGDSIGARKTDNVFSIRTPVAIAIGVRNGPPNPHTPAQVWKTKLIGPEKSKLETLDSVHSFTDLDWRKCSREWDAPFYPTGAGSYFDWPALTDVFPWQHSGSQLKRTWPIGETQEVLTRRWRSLLDLSTDRQRDAFKETRDRKIDRRYQPLTGDGTRASPISALRLPAPVPLIERYAYRSFDQHFVIADSRVGDFMRPDLWRAHSDSQVYITSLLTDILGAGPAATAAVEIPDLHRFHGRGAKDVIPLWRDSEATQPNVTKGILKKLGEEYGSPVTAERLFAYAYGVLAQPTYVTRFWDELELPPPRLPITKDAPLFEQVAEHGARLLYLHTYGQRFARSEDDGSIRHGTARCAKSVSLEEYPQDFSYDPNRQTLRVGDGEFAPVAPEIWNYSVSGLQVVKSWLDYRKLKRAGRKSSPLDEIRPERWDFTEELLKLLWLLEATLDLQPEGEALLERVCASDTFSQTEMPTPTEAEREPPSTTTPTQPVLMDPTQGDEVVITANGEYASNVVPYQPKSNMPFGRNRDNIQILGDIVSPMPAEWFEKSDEEDLF